MLGERGVGAVHRWVLALDGFTIADSPAHEQVVGWLVKYFFDAVLALIRVERYVIREQVINCHRLFFHCYCTATTATPTGGGSGSSGSWRSSVLLAVHWQSTGSTGSWAFWCAIVT